jgi:glycosyltransferase involved in cell wall biosynthesis
MSRNFVDGSDHIEIKNFAEDKHAENLLVTNISICVALKNRTVFEHKGKTYYPFKNFVKSLTRINRHRFNLELVVADFNSTDIVLESWIYDEIKHVELKIIKVNSEYFSRGKGLNIAVDNSKYGILFLVDADMILSDQVLQRGMIHLKRNKTFFPIALKHIDEKMKVTRWFQTGTGNVMIMKKLYNNMGRFPEYNTWGKEDKKLFDTMVQIHNKPVVREKCKGFFHQWHPLILRHKYSENSTLTD